MSRESCVGNNFPATSAGFQAWKAVWDQAGNPCKTIYSTFVNSEAGGAVNPANLATSKNEFVEIYDNYLVKHGKDFTESGQSGYDVMQDSILQACNGLPGSCIPASNKYRNLRGYNRSQISNNRGFLDFYGCVSPLTGLTSASVNALADDKPCDPLCHRVSTIQLFNDSGQLQECNRAVCVIDDVTINAIESSAESVNFTQVCNNCTNKTNKTTGCTCIISGVDINQVWSDIGQANFDQDCGPNSLCEKIVNGVATPVNCAQEIGTSNVVAKDTVPIWYIVGGIALAVIILAIIYLFIMADKSRPKASLY